MSRCTETPVHLHEIRQAARRARLGLALGLGLALRLAPGAEGQVTPAQPTPPPAGAQPATPAPGARFQLPTGPVAEPPIHDPVLIQQGKTFYAFGTGRGIPTWTSTDLKLWQFAGPAIATTPAWIKQVIPGNRGDMWAPDIIERKGTYYLYYAVSLFGRNSSAIGVATNTTLDASDPAYRWVDRGMVVQSVPGRDLWNAIDAHVVLDTAGTPWLDFGSFWGGIKMVRLDSTMTRVAQPEDWRTVAARERYWKLDDRDAGDAANPELKYDSIYPARIVQMSKQTMNGGIEGPVVFARNGWYYLFASWDRCCRGDSSTYKVVVGRSREVTGPYLDREGQKMIHGGGSLVVQGFGESPRWAAGGHNDAVTIAGTDYLVFHAYDRTDNGRSRLLLRPIHWDRWGWPLVDVDEDPSGGKAAPKGKK